MVLALTGSPPNSAIMVNTAVNAELASFWTPLAGLADVGRNKLHNPLFNLWQRGTTAVTSSAYTADRWFIGVATDTVSVTRATLSDTDRSQIGDEEATYGLQNVFTGSATANAANDLIQRIESVRRLSGKTITVSFWAKCASGTLKIGLGVTQVFGTGGSPSAAVATYAASPVTITTTWARYSLSIAVPSASGLTFGTTLGSDYTQLGLAYSAQNTATFSAIGVQSGTVTLYGVQLEVGASMTALERPDPRYDLSNCQRFYQIGQVIWSGGLTSGIGYTAFSPFPTAMRATPTAGTTTDTSSNVGTRTVAANAYGMTVTATASSTATGGLNVIYTASADL